MKSGAVLVVMAVLLTACSGSNGDTSPPVDGATTAAPLPAASTTSARSDPPSTSTSRTTQVVSTVSTVSTTATGAESLADIVERGYEGGVGAVIVGVFEETAVMAAAGVDGDGRPVTADRPWMTASLAKVITATAVLQLVEDGGIDLDAPIADYFDFPMSDRITVRHVM